MDFFDKEIEKLNKASYEEKASETPDEPIEAVSDEQEITAENNEVQEVAEALPEAECPNKALICDGDLFWGDLIAHQKVKQSRRHYLLYILSLLIALLIGAAITLTLFYGKGWLHNLLSGDDNLMNFTLPIYDRPQLETEYYDDDGRYTSEGIAKALSESVVSIVVYYDLDTSKAAASSSQGSGIVISEDGYIVTNAHVVSDDPIGIKVVLCDKTEYAATVVGSDIRSDIAVIKISADGLTPAQFSDSDKVEVGEDVVAIGSPAGLYGSITKGVVSAVNRMIKTGTDNLEMSCIQIDAAINPGNSGGALLNMWGQVIGITSSKLSSAYYDGIGFAISTNAAKPIIEELIENGYVTGRIRIGITFYGVSAATAEIYGLAASGLYITEVAQECDISNTQLKVGDVITHINGKTVTSLTETTKALEGFKPGDKVTATVVSLNDDMTQITDAFEITFALAEDLSGISGFIEESSGQ